METSTASPTKAKTTALVVVVVAFIAGLLVGVAGDHVYLIHSRRLFSRHGMESMKQRMLNRLDRELDLNPQQREQVHRIIETHHQRIEVLSSSVRPQIREELERANREISAILTPDQRVKYQAIRVRMHGGPRLHPPDGSGPFGETPLHR